MSDTADEMRNQLAAHLARAYAALATICLNLPIPVTLPGGIVTVQDAVPAVRRLLEITEDQPMPEEAQANLFAACAFWLGAEDIFRLLVVDEFNGARAHSCAANLIMCEETMHDVTVFLLGEQE